MAVQEALVVPVGHDLGARTGGAGAAVRRYQVRVGSEVMELSDQEYVVWMLAHSINDRDRPTRGSMLDQAGRFGLDRFDANATIDQFFDDGLLAEVGPDAGVGFARKYQLHPLLLGLGPDPEREGTLLLGLLGQPIVQVSPALYDLWSWAHLSTELWEACQDAAVAQRQGATSPTGLDPVQVLAGVLESLHGLLRVRAAYLDAA